MVLNVWYRMYGVVMETYERHEKGIWSNLHIKNGEIYLFILLYRNLIKDIIKREWYVHYYYLIIRNYMYLLNIFSYNSYFLACFFSRNSVFLSQQISWNNVSACFFSEANGAILFISLFNFSRHTRLICQQ